MDPAHEVELFHVQVKYADVRHDRNELEAAVDVHRTVFQHLPDPAAIPSDALDRELHDRRVVDDSYKHLDPNNVRSIRKIAQYLVFIDVWIRKF